MDNLAALFLILLCLCLEGLFSGGELALVSCDVNKIRRRARAGSRRAALCLKLIEKPEWFLATTLTGTNLCVVTGATVATGLFIDLYGAAQGALVSIMVMIPTLLILGEIIPKSIFQQYADDVAETLSPFIWLASWLFSPVVFIISRITHGTIRLSMGEKDVSASSYITRSGLKYILDRHGEESDILSAEKDMVTRILDFSEVTVGQIMTPLSVMTALPSTATIREAAYLLAEKKYLRVPVYRDQVLNVIGILHYFDLLTASQGISAPSIRDSDTVERLLRPAPIYVPESKPAKDLLVELRGMRERMAVVVDEYGGALGIVTTEDILEEIVGEIHDEYTTGAKSYKRIAPGMYLFHAQTSIDQIRTMITTDIPEGQYATLGGFLLHKMGKIPKRKEIFRLGQILFVIEATDTKSIREIMIIFPAELEKTEEKERGVDRGRVLS
jgi:CBS domain containing-hemolysin-like protein